MLWLKRLVIPLFVNQIKHNKEITVRSNDKILMSLEDSVDLVLHAAETQNRVISLFKKHLHQL